MLRTQRECTLVVLVLFMLCLPLHIISSEVSAMHHTSHGMMLHHGGHTPEPATSIFSHFEDMTNAPWVALLFLLFVVYVVALLRAHEPRAFRTFVRYILHHAYDHFDTGDIKRWISRRVMSPPYCV